MILVPAPVLLIAILKNQLEILQHFDLVFDELKLMEL